MSDNQKQSKTEGEDQSTAAATTQNAQTNAPSSDNQKQSKTDLAPGTEVKTDKPLGQGVKMGDLLPPKGDEKPLESSPILDTAASGKPDTHFCPATSEYSVSKYMVKRTKDSDPVPACEKCIGPAYTYHSMEMIKS